MTTNGGFDAYAAQSFESEGTACRSINARVLIPVWRLKPYAFAASAARGTSADSEAPRAAFAKTSIESRNVCLCPPNAAAKVAFQQATSRSTPSVPSAVAGTRPALVPSRENFATPNPSSPPIASVSPADAKSVRTIPASYDLYTYGVIPKYFAGGGTHPNTRTTSSSRSRHSHETCAPPEPSGSTRAVSRNASRSASDGFASPSAGASSDAAASRELRANSRAPMSVVSEEDKEDARLADGGASVADSATRGAVSDSEGVRRASSSRARVDASPKKPSDIHVSSETFRAAPNEDALGLLALLVDDTGVVASCDSAVRAAARLSRKMSRGSSVTGWRRMGGQRGVVRLPETRRSTEGKRAQRRGSRSRRTSIAHPYVLEGLACEQSRQSGSMSAWLNTHIAPLWTLNPFASNAASKTSAVRARASKDVRGHPASEASTRGTQRVTSAKQARHGRCAILQTRHTRGTAREREYSREVAPRARGEEPKALVFVVFVFRCFERKNLRARRCGVRSADAHRPPRPLGNPFLRRALSRGHLPPAWASPPCRPRPWAPTPRAPFRVPPRARAAAAARASAEPEWAARTS